MLKCCRLKGDPKSDSASEGGLAFAVTGKQASIRMTSPDILR